MHICAMRQNEAIYIYEAIETLEDFLFIYFYFFIFYYVWNDKIKSAF